jgi:probable HAF family extracellular repeat protein
MFPLKYLSLLGRAVIVGVVITSASVIPAQAHTRYPYTLVDPGTFGGPQNDINLPAVPLTPRGVLLGSADTTTADVDYPNVNPFTVLFPDQNVAHAFEWQDGRLHDLGALPGNNSSAVFEVNGRGTGVGMSEDGGTDSFTDWPTVHATMFRGGHVSDLGSLPGGQESFAIAINDRGQAAGMSSDGTPDPFSVFGWGTETRGFAWQNGVMTDLGTLGGGDTLVNAQNQRGQITGSSYTNGTPNAATGLPTSDPFLYHSGRMRDLGSLGGTYGVGNWLNDEGDVVGQSNLAGDQSTRPFLWNGRKMINLGDLGGGFGFADYINDRNDVAGASLAPDGNFHGFRWHEGQMIDLPPVGGAPWAFANSINNGNQVVGNETDAGGSEEVMAVLWNGRTGYDLNTLVAPNQLHMASAEYINDRGDIVGHGVLANGEQRMFLLIRSPSVPLPAAAASVARARRSERSPHRRLTPALARRLMSKFGPAARSTRRPAF